ncbi:unnamed protein product [Lactuca saligna]|uniref:Uncharacterized protein n=1 Tax=Lactuca saligna TaxID=75948 RepID=A0AA35YK29_LACSI|nr:unnamed protein product [Lactuca saligna]
MKKPSFLAASIAAASATTAITTSNRKNQTSPQGHGSSSNYNEDSSPEKKSCCSEKFAPRNHRSGCKFQRDRKGQEPSLPSSSSVAWSRQTHRGLSRKHNPEHLLPHIIVGSEKKEQSRGCRSNYAAITILLNIYTPIEGRISIPPSTLALS